MKLVGYFSIILSVLTIRCPANETSSQFATFCAVCHGTKGEGNRELNAPSIAGLPAWYAEIQLRKFRTGMRGTGSDHTGAVMRAIALTLTEDSLPKLATHIAALEPMPTKTDLPHDLEQTAELYFETCAPCHRFNGHGERVFRSAPITLLPDWYLTAALIKYRDGHRGTHAEDESGLKMREVTNHLSTETIAELVRYLGVLAEKYPPRRKPSRNAP